MTLLSVKVASIEGKLGEVQASGEARSHALETSLIKWMIGTVITAVALAFAIAKFVS